MGAWRYTTEVINGVCQKVYHWYDVVGPAEVVKAVAGACVKGALGTGIIVGAGVATNQAVKRYARGPSSASQTAGASFPWNASGPGFSQPLNGGANAREFERLGGYGFDFGGSGGGGGYSSRPDFLAQAPGQGNDLAWTGLIPVFNGDQFFSTQPALADEGFTGLNPFAPGDIPAWTVPMAPGGSTDTPSSGGNEAVPEPGTLALLGAAVLFLVFVCKRIG